MRRNQIINLLIALMFVTFIPMLRLYFQGNTKGFIISLSILGGLIALVDYILKKREK